MELNKLMERLKLGESLVFTDDGTSYTVTARKAQAAMSLAVSKQDIKMMPNPHPMLDTLVDTCLDKIRTSPAYMMEDLK